MFFGVLLFVELWTNTSLNSFSGLWLNAISAQKLPLWSCTFLLVRFFLVHYSVQNPDYAQVEESVMVLLILLYVCGSIAQQMCYKSNKYYCHCKELFAFHDLPKLQTSGNTISCVMPVSEWISSSSWGGDSPWCELGPKSSRQFWSELPTTSPTCADA